MKVSTARSTELGTTSSRRSPRRGAAGPYTEYDGLPVLHATETGLPLLHPYGPVPEGRCVPPGGGRLTVGSNGRHRQITLDHLGCPAQDTEEKAAAFRRLALAGEGHCLHAGCRHKAAHQAGILRSFEFPAGSIPVTAFVRALLAIEGDERPAARLLQEAEALIGPVRPLDGHGGEGRPEAG
ncbi:DUF6420 family protein [Streptomyces sp. H27-S2]|uniref:DUF6420 family protein n=1 Tax=Streptomyces antarcticus TaxID=2996458 RepID=UPI0022710326|nr:DUF6420 family protein [Streptomyces sp. H27-S2]MCY0953073.1 DUF6420 family protein [Streptomyces sp. H27-S2]